MTDHEKIDAVSGKRFRDIDVSRLNFDEYFTSRLWAAWERAARRNEDNVIGAAILDVGSEYILAPLRAVRFAFRKISHPKPYSSMMA